jgi:hypothetical protein
MIHDMTEPLIRPGAAVDCVVLAPLPSAVRCRILGGDHQIVLRSHTVVGNIIPGDILTIVVSKQWRHGGDLSVAGDVVGSRVDVPALGLTPLQLRDEWSWHPEEHYWGEDDEPLADWAKRIIVRGARPSYEMEQVIPGEDPEDWDSDPIIEASELNMAGRKAAARKLLFESLSVDLRCLDAHAHLGNFAFGRNPAKALRHYEMGVRIGELSLGPDFDGLLPWGRLDNRPFLRCLHGYGLSLWRLGRGPEAAEVFERMLWLNPTDNQGIRFLLPAVCAGEGWSSDY